MDASHAFARTSTRSSKAASAKTPFTIAFASRPRSMRLRSRSKCQTHPRKAQQPPMPSKRLRAIEIDARGYLRLARIVRIATRANKLEEDGQDRDHDDCQ